MTNYQYTIIGNTVQVVGHEQDVCVYDFDNWKPMVARDYKSLLAHKKDMEYARDYLNQMFFRNDTTLIDSALINSAIQILVKCFSSQGRIRLDEKKVFRSFTKEIGEQDFTTLFAQFKEARDKVLSHDENSFNDCVVGLAVNNVSGIAEDVAEITVQTGYLYEENQKLLLRMVTVVLMYLDKRLGETKKRLIEEYNQLPVKPILNTAVVDVVQVASVSD